MKRSFILAAIILLASFSSVLVAQQPTQVKNQSSDQPYKVHATKITLGNAAYAQKVLWAWKYYDNNTMDKGTDLFADDIVATLPDGTLIKGKENFLKGMQDYRNTFSSAISDVAACTTLKSPDDPDREIVTIWGMETDTSKDGTVTKVHLNEVWFFNKQGKVVEFHQLAAKDTPDK
jgi:hypothetical protein